MFSSPHGDFSFSINNRFWLYRMGGTSFRPLTGISLFLWTLHGGSVSANICFRPLTGISLFLWKIFCTATKQDQAFSSPHGDFSFSINNHWTVENRGGGFRPLTGISLFLYRPGAAMHAVVPFSSPHGDFSFSIVLTCYNYENFPVFVPSRGFLFFYGVAGRAEIQSPVFVPSRGFLFFY